MAVTTDRQWLPGTIAWRLDNENRGVLVLRASADSVWAEVSPNTGGGALDGQLDVLEIALEWALHEFRARRTAIEQALTPEEGDEPF